MRMVSREATVFVVVEYLANTSLCISKKSVISSRQESPNVITVLDLIVDKEIPI